MARPIKMQHDKEITTMADMNNSSEEPMPSSDINHLESVFKHLTNFNLGLLILAGIIALIIGVISVAINRISGQILTAKDRQLTFDIEKVKQESLKESKRIGTEADQKIATAKNDSDQKIAGANRRSEEISNESKRKTAELRAQNLSTEERLVVAQQELERERLTRLDLEKSLRPREMYLVIYKDGTSNIDNLKTLAGTDVILESIPDAEAKRAAGDIAFILKQAGLKIVHTGITTEQIWDAVTIESYRSTSGGTDEDDIRSSTMAIIVAEFFGDEEWVAQTTSSRHGELQPNTLRIRVGFKPSPYFSATPEWEKKIMDRVHTLRRKPPIPKDKPIHVRLRSTEQFPSPPSIEK